MIISNNLICLAKIFDEKAPLYIVGGFVRDFLLKKESHDIDLCSSLTLEEVEILLKGTEYKFATTNKKFGTAKIECNGQIYEYTCFRQDFYDLSGKHSPQKINFVKDIKIDANRRDFTINSLYFNILTGEIIDFYGGLNDLKTKKLKMINNNTLNFDAERILRLIYLQSKYNFTIEHNTFEMAKVNSQKINNLSNNIIKTFFDKLNKLKQNQLLKAKQTLITLNRNDLIKYIKEE